MSDEEEDYMSDKFLSGIADVRPSLIQQRAKKRQIEIATKQTEHTKRQRDQSGLNSNERLQESLKRPIETTNKGFQLLAKMGYTPGQALGKNKNTNTAEHKPLTEPIAISIKSDRGGLGREAALLELTEKRRQLRQARLLKAAAGEVMTTEEFRRRATQKAEERFVHGALRRCQLTCENLDIEHKVETPVIAWFWPERPVAATEEEDVQQLKVEEDPCVYDEKADDAEDEYTEADKLDMILAYLRTAYTFCFWCGVRYQDQSDMDSNCPGLTRDEH